MGENLNKEWKLKGWGPDDKQWGYPVPEGHGCTENNPRRYCYPRLIRGGVSRWAGLTEWLNKKLLGAHSPEWGKKFNPTLNTNLRSTGSGFLNWGEVVDKVMSKVEANLIIEKTETNLAMLWTAPEWYKILGEPRTQNIDWNTHPQGKAVLMVVVCIITGLTADKQDEGKQYANREILCKTIDKGLVVDEDHWDSWKSRRGIEKDRDSGQCSTEEAYENCQDPSLSLIVTIYGALRALCPNCGPYKLTRWIKKSKNRPKESTNLYCNVTKGIFTCDKTTDSPSAGGALWLERALLAPEKGESAEGTGHSDAVKSVLSMTESEIPQPQKDRQSNNNIVIKGLQELGLKEEARECVESNSNTTPDSSKKCSEQAAQSNQLEEKISGLKSQGPEEAGKRSSARTQGTPPDQGGAGRESDESNSSTGTNERKTDEPENFGPVTVAHDSETGTNNPVGGVVGGILGVLLLAVAAAYGIFRIWGRRRKSKEGRTRLGTPRHLSYEIPQRGGIAAVGMSALRIEP
ncbi:hypothetical protein C922_04688 [Plasmodium inui San Antonio 1]|uniref:Uncharacterized protein n=1 Tax=Plasmodium inui San Antonio 1 TaxID=1237626 RepID=W7AI37_9APIC|nr:hypothetical protein C922_04688 [Plasmodium inui San Antonio 1]EUD64956.1 hypothetical protein C922_04688 [Plasmodium inui San Antonio 1]